MSTPSSSIVPDVGSIRRLIIRIDVVLPQPDGPTSVVIFPAGAVIVRLSTATVPSGYRLDTLSNVIMTVLLGELNSKCGSAGRRLLAAAKASSRPYWAAFPLETR